MIYNSVDELVGSTPLLRLHKYEDKNKIDANILAKLEYLNPTGSVKDRAALYIINDAEEKGLLDTGSTIIEPTSGNTGIGLAAIGVSRGYEVIIVMPETMSIERQKLIKAYGAKLVLTDGKLGMAGAIAEALRLNKEIKGSIIAGQFVNSANTLSHIETTGPEIWDDTLGLVDIVVAGIGTGGTITGIASYLKKMNPQIKIIGVEPESSPLITKGESGSHKIQGIGANFIPEILDLKLVDEVTTVSNSDAYKAVHDLINTEGVLVGISSGAALSVATTIAKKEENVGKNIVVIMPDSGIKYLSTDLFE